MSRRMTKLVALLIFFGCCSFVGGSGCSVHRTGEGFVFDSHWSLACSEHAPWLDFRPSADLAAADGKPVAATTASGGAEPASPPKDAACVTQQTPAKPELLPWRSRLKARLAARGLPGQEATSSGPSAEASSAASDDATRETDPTSAASQAVRPDPVIE